MGCLNLCEDLEKLKKMDEPTDPKAIIPWCNKGYTVEKSKKECPVGGCWKYRCFDSKLHGQWSEERTKWRKERYGRT
jgi:hypothetical protein